MPFFHSNTISFHINPILPIILWNKPWMMLFIYTCSNIQLHSNLLWFRLHEPSAIVCESFQDWTDISFPWRWIKFLPFGIECWFARTFNKHCNSYTPILYHFSIHVILPMIEWNEPWMMHFIYTCSNIQLLSNLLWFRLHEPSAIVCESCQDWPDISF